MGVHQIKVLLFQEFPHCIGLAHKKERDQHIPQSVFSKISDDATLVCQTFTPIEEVSVAHYMQIAEVLMVFRSWRMGGKHRHIKSCGQPLT